MITVLFMDVDGTLTDGKIHMGENGELYKSFDVKDGYGISNILPKYGIIPVIITARTSVALRIRCEELNIKNVYQGCKDKVKILKDVADYIGLKKVDKIYKDAAYIGDDIPDLDCMEIVEYKGCPKDAVKKVKEISDFVSKYNGGAGAVREFIDWLVQSENEI